MSPLRFQNVETTTATITSKINAFLGKVNPESKTRDGSGISHQVIEMTTFNKCERETEIVSGSQELNWVKASQKKEDLIKEKLASESYTITSMNNELNKVKSSVTRLTENILLLKQETAQAAAAVKKNRIRKAMLKLEQAHLTQEIKIIGQGTGVEEKRKLFKIQDMLALYNEEIHVTDECWKELLSVWQSLTAELQTQERRYSDLLEFLILLCSTIADSKNKCKSLEDQLTDSVCLEHTFVKSSNIMLNAIGIMLGLSSKKFLAEE